LHIMLCGAKSYIEVLHMFCFRTSDRVRVKATYVPLAEQQIKLEIILRSQLPVILENKYTRGLCAM
jgi:hypothetical protein